MGYVVRSDGDPIYELEFERDKLGRITQKIEWIDDGTSASAKTWDYEYDNADRLTTVTLNGGSPGVYTYDDNGNRLSYTSLASAATNGTCGAQDRMASYGGIGYAYTAAGDLPSPPRIRSPIPLSCARRKGSLDSRPRHAGGAVP